MIFFVVFFLQKNIFPIFQLFVIVIISVIYFSSIQNGYWMVACHQDIPRNILVELTGQGHSQPGQRQGEKAIGTYQVKGNFPKVSFREDKKIIFSSMANNPHTSTLGISLTFFMLKMSIMDKTVLNVFLMIFPQIFIFINHFIFRNSKKTNFFT